MNPNQALWEKGNFSRIAETMRDSGTEHVAQLGVRPGMRVLDLGCGDGTTALPAARLGADVTGIDISRPLVEAAQRRAQAESLTRAQFRHGDACRLDGVDDASFDLIVSFFGAMFAPDPMAVAREMVRVTRPGGRIVMANWIPGDPTLVAQILRICSGFLPPPPPQAVSPMTWGVEDTVRERFAAAGVPGPAVQCERARYTFVHPEPPRAFLALFRQFYGPTMNAYDAATAAGRRDVLESELTRLFETQNASDDPRTTRITATCLKVTVTRP